MRLRVIFLILYTCLFNLQAQNLVDNPGFEDIYTKELRCDYYQSGREYNSVFKSGWSNAGQGTSDIYSLYVDSNCVTYAFPKLIPSRFVVNRLPHSGKTMSAFLAYDYTYNYPGYNHNYREYIQNKLKSPVIKGQKYRVTFYVLLHENSNRAVNNIGVHFSVEEIPVPIGYYQSQLKKEPQIEYKQTIQEHTNWVKLDTIIEASANWQYLTIGNFRDDVSTNIVNVKTPANSYFFKPNAGYYIDDVSVEPVCEKTYAEPVSICYGKATTLQAPDFLKLRGWADSTRSTKIISTDFQINVNPLKPSTYYLYFNYCDTIVYKVNVLGSLSVNLGIDHGLYKNQNIILNATNKNAVYLWQDGSDKQHYNVNQSGTYWVEVSDSYGCHVSDTIKITDIILEMPNVFTPTNDNVNDHFTPMTMSGIKSAELSIYNRWGTLIYKTIDLEQGWDGANAVMGVDPDGGFFGGGGDGASSVRPPSNAAVPAGTPAAQYTSQPKAHTLTAYTPGALENWGNNQNFFAKFAYEVVDAPYVVAQKFNPFNNYQTETHLNGDPVVGMDGMVGFAKTAEIPTYFISGGATKTAQVGESFLVKIFTKPPVFKSVGAAGKNFAQSAGIKLTGGGLKKIGNLAHLKDTKLADAILLRGGKGANLNKLQKELLDKTVGEVANLAATGDPAASLCIKVLKEAKRLAAKY